MYSSILNTFFKWYHLRPGIGLICWSKTEGTWMEAVAVQQPGVTRIVRSA